MSNNEIICNICEEVNTYQTIIQCQACFCVCCNSCYTTYLHHSSIILTSIQCVKCKAKIGNADGSQYDILQTHIMKKTQKDRDKLKIVETWRKAKSAIEKKQKYLERKVNAYKNDIEAIKCGDIHVDDNGQLHRNGEQDKEIDSASEKLLQSTSTCCPTCMTRITKSEGCDDMYCVICHTYFDYVSGHIKSKVENVEADHYRYIHAVHNDKFPRNYLRDELSGDTIHAARNIMYHMLEVKTQNAQIMFKIKQIRFQINNLHIEYNAKSLNQSQYYKSLKMLLENLERHIKCHKAMNRAINKINLLSFPPIETYINLAEQVLGIASELNKTMTEECGREAIILDQPIPDSDSDSDSE